MPNKNLFSTSRQNVAVPVVNTVNNAGGVAYAMSAKHALAQLASTGCFNDTFYTSSETQLKDVLELAAKVSPEFVAKTAIYARERGFMKDMPAFLLAYLSKHSELFAKILPRVVDNPKMLRNVVQMIRSGATGRKSLGTRPKRAIQSRLASWDDKTLFRGSVGNQPSLADVIKMVHPKPANASRDAMHRYLIGKEFDVEKLPVSVQEFESFKKGLTQEVPDVPFEMLTALPLNQKQWAQIARNASWTKTRMNLNTFLRHGVFSESGMDKLIADRIKNQDLISRAKVFPYQLMTAYFNCDDGVPSIVKNALQEAMEHATSNVAKLDGKVYIFTDVSGSMSSAVTGARGSATSKVRYIDVAALITSTILRRNPDAEVIPFEGNVVDIKRLNINPMDSIMTNAQKLSSIAGGSTNCSAPLALLNTQKAKADLVIYVSDNESWVDTNVTSNSYGASKTYYYANNNGRGTATMDQWKVFKSRNPKAKMVCIDIAPNKTMQAAGSKDILNVGGFSDQVFDIINTFLTDGVDGETWTKKIEEIAL